MGCSGSCWILHTFKDEDFSAFLGSLHWCLTNPMWSRFSCLQWEFPNFQLILFASHPVIVQLQKGTSFTISTYNILIGDNISLSSVWTSTFLPASPNASCPSNNPGDFAGCTPVCCCLPLENLKLSTTPWVGWVMLSSGEGKHLPWPAGHTPANAAQRCHWLPLPQGCIPGSYSTCPTGVPGLHLHSCTVNGMYWCLDFLLSGSRACNLLCVMSWGCCWPISTSSWGTSEQQACPPAYWPVSPVCYCSLSSWVCTSMLQFRLLIMKLNSVSPSSNPSGM